MKISWLQRTPYDNVQMLIKPDHNTRWNTTYTSSMNHRQDRYWNPNQETNYPLGFKNQWNLQHVWHGTFFTYGIFRTYGSLVGNRGIGEDIAGKRYGNSNTRNTHFYLCITSRPPNISKNYGPLPDRVWETIKGNNTMWILRNPLVSIVLPIIYQTGGR
jgi:hypothetical protein